MQEKPRYQSDEGANGAKESNLDDAADDTFQDTVSPLETTPGLYKCPGKKDYPEHSQFQLELYGDGGEAMYS